MSRVAVPSAFRPLPRRRALTDARLSARRQSTSLPSSSTSQLRSSSSLVTPLGECPPRLVKSHDTDPHFPPPVTTRSRASFPVTCSSPSETTRSSTVSSDQSSSPREEFCPTSTRSCCLRTFCSHSTLAVPSLTPLSLLGRLPREARLRKRFRVSSLLFCNHLFRNPVLFVPPARSS